MSLKFEYEVNGNYQEFNLEAGNSGIRQFESFYLKILLSCFKEKQLKIVTCQPQRYSLAFELPGNSEYVDPGKGMLVTNVFGDFAMLKLISESEEFARGLLVVCLNTSDVATSMFNIVAFQQVKAHDMGKIDGTVCFCDHDGGTVYVVNHLVRLDGLIDAD